MGTLAPITKAHRLGKLAGELEAALPALRPVGTGALRRSPYTLAEQGDTLFLTVPDGVTQAQVEAVINAHDPTTPSAAEQDDAQAGADLATFRDNLLQARQLLGWDAATRAYNAAAGQWDALTPAQRTVFWRRTLDALAALGRRAGG